MCAASNWANCSHRQSPASVAFFKETRGTFKHLSGSSHDRGTGFPCRRTCALCITRFPSRADVDPSFICTPATFSRVVYFFVRIEQHVHNVPCSTGGETVSVMLTFPVKIRVGHAWPAERLKSSFELRCFPRSSLDCVLERAEIGSPRRTSEFSACLFVADCQRTVTLSRSGVFLFRDHIRPAETFRGILSLSLSQSFSLGGN